MRVLMVAPAHLQVTKDHRVLLDAHHEYYLADVDGRRLVGAGHAVELDAHGRPVAAGTAGDANEVPDGSADEVLAWVGDDRERASRALEAETGRARPRVRLTAALQEVVAGGPVGPSETKTGGAEDEDAEVEDEEDGGG